MFEQELQLSMIYKDSWKLVFRIEVIVGLESIGEDYRRFRLLSSSKWNRIK